MSNYSTLKAAISAVIKENNNHEITGQVLQTTLLAMVDSLAGGYLFKGIATPATVVGTPDENVFYIGGGGVYSNFGATPVHVPDGCIGIFTYNGSFENHIIPTGGVFDISAYNAVGGTPATYANLQAALGTNGANIPDYLRKGGMSVKFIQGNAPSSDNNYVQARLMANTFTTNVTQWQVVDDEPTADSKNLLESGGTQKYVVDESLFSATGYVIDNDHNIQPVDGVRKYIYNNRFNLLIVKIPKDATKITLSGADFSSSYITYYKKLADIYTPDGHINVGRSMFYPTEKSRYIPSSPDYVANYACIQIYKQANPDFNGDAIGVDYEYAYCSDNADGLLGLRGKKVSILGDSISTFNPYSYFNKPDESQERVDRYPFWLSINTGTDNDVSHINQTWWMQFIKRGGGILERNNSIGGSGISLASEPGTTVTSCFLRRYKDLGNPDVILVAGLANDPYTAEYYFNPDMEFDPSTFDPENIEAVGNFDPNRPIDAYNALLQLLRYTYPNARIINILTNAVNPKKGVSAIEMFKYYGYEYVNVQEIADKIETIGTQSVPDTTHPNVSGMKTFGDYVVSKIKQNVAASKDTIPTKNSTNLVESGGVYGAAPAFHKDSPYNDDNVLRYLTDENYTIYAIQYKDGSIKKIVDTPEEKTLKNNVVTLIETQALSKEVSPYNDTNVITYLTDEDDNCWGQINKDGTLVLYKTSVVKNDKLDEQLISVISLLANGLDNVSLSANPKTMASILNVFGKNPVYINKGNKNNLNLKPCISIIDDDTIDRQIPSSVGGSTPATRDGGYFSVMLPLLLSLGDKHNKKLVGCVASEGHRIGLTAMNSSNDTYSSLNENGNAVKWLHDNMGWNVLNHSMTAQLPMQAYYVDGINSTLAQRIISEYTGIFYEPFSFYNLIVLDRNTGKWYELNNQSQSAWVERTPTKKYAMPFYQDYVTKDWYFNRNFDFDYSWGEWYKRADELGLPYEKGIVHNGSTSSIYMAYASRKYSPFSIRTNGTHNYPPIPVTVNRIANNTGNNNVKNSSYETKLLTEVDRCFSNNTWMVFMTHFYSATHYNYYVEGLTYPDKDENYSSEWEVPLKYEEIQDIIGANTHDYINNPPARLGISSWKDWVPASGTQLRTLYDVLDYALSKGIEIVPVKKGWETHGNILNIGADRNGQRFTWDSAENQVPYTEEEQSYLTIGADLSIRYYNSKNNI